MSHQILPEHIRASLAQYPEHQECTCLSCGYSGLMGVYKEEDKISWTKSIAIFSVIIGLLALYDFMQEMKGQSKLPWWVIPLVGLGIGAYTSRKRIYLACPNCNAVLKMK